jgi:hypothetical protein
VEFFYTNTMAWTRLPQLPGAASSGPVFVHDGDDLFLVNPNHNNVMHFDLTRLSFEIIPGQGTAVTGPYVSVLPVTDDLLHNC